jgi:hypothetical protein
MREKLCTKEDWLALAIRVAFTLGESAPVLLQSFILRSGRLLSLPKSCGGEVGIWTAKAGTLRRRLSCGEYVGWATPKHRSSKFPQHGFSSILNWRHMTLGEAERRKGVISQFVLSPISYIMIN